MMEEVEEPLLSKRNGCISKRPLEDTASISEDNPVVVMARTISSPMTKGRIAWTMLVLNFSLFSYYLGFMAISNLQSTINSTKGLGVISQASIYAASMFGSLLLPDFLIKTFGCKRCIVCAVMCHIPYIAMNFHPTWETLIPSAVLLGVAAGPLTTSNAYYTNEMAKRFHMDSIDADFEVIMAKFYSVYAFFSANTQIWGNLISYYVLCPKMLPIINYTAVECGVNFRKDEWNVSNVTNPNLDPPTDQQRDLLVSIFLCCGVASVLTIMSFVSPLGNDIVPEPTKRKCAAIRHNLGAALRQVTKLDQMFLIPLPIFCGLEIAFYTCDFTQAFIACSWGIHHVGFVTICFGACGALMAVSVGFLVKCLSQMAVIIIAAFLEIIICIILFIWQPSPEVPSAYFLLAGVWGMTDAVWWSQIPALYGLMFPNDREAAFSNFYFWSFFGYFLSFSYSNYLTVAVKINIMLAFLVIGIVLYVIGQIKIKRSVRTSYVTIDEPQ